MASINGKVSKINIEDLLEKAMNAPTCGAEIASELVQRIVNVGEDVLNHFTRYMQDASVPGKLIIYDYRDNEDTGRVPPTLESYFYVKDTIAVTLPPNTQNYTYTTEEKGLVCDYQRICLPIYFTCRGQVSAHKQHSPNIIG